MTDDQYGKLMLVINGIKDLKPETDSFSDKFRAFIDKLIGNGYISDVSDEQWKKFEKQSQVIPVSKPAPSTVVQTETFDYEHWYTDCPYGVYNKEEKKVHCSNPSPRMKSWLPKDRKVDPQVCDKCWERRTYIQEKKQPSSSPEEIYCEHGGLYVTQKACDKCRQISYNIWSNCRTRK